MAKPSKNILQRLAKRSIKELEEKQLGLFLVKYLGTEFIKDTVLQQLEMSIEDHNSEDVERFFSGIKQVKA